LILGVELVGFKINKRISLCIFSYHILKFFFVILNLICLFKFKNALAGEVAQVVEHLPSKAEAPSSSPSAANK
jgi:hypothetical protein